MKKIKKEKLTTQDWIPIEEILNNGIIKTKDNNYLKIIKVIPINYNLKSDLEKSSILNSYKTFLKTCNFDIQILIQSNKEDLNHHISNITNNINNKKNSYLENLANNYLEYIKKLNLTKKSSSKDFYIIISNKKDLNHVDSYEISKSELKEKYFKIKECLSRCGNSVIEINSKEEILKIIYSFINTRKNINN